MVLGAGLPALGLLLRLALPLQPDFTKHTLRALR